jgi:DNA-binding MarR family transcriptional regulator
MQQKNDYQIVSDFREILREFERENNFQNNHHCCKGISITQCHALMEIGKRPEIKLVDLSERLNLDKSTVSRTIDGLVKNNLVKRNVPDGNRRVTNISLSQNGSKLFKKINQDNNTFYSKVLDNIPNSEKENFLRLFSLFVKGMQENRSSTC